MCSSQASENWPDLFHFNPVLLKNGLSAFYLSCYLCPHVGKESVFSLYGVFVCFVHVCASFSLCVQSARVSTGELVCFSHTFAVVARLCRRCLIGSSFVCMHVCLCVCVCACFLSVEAVEGEGKLVVE